jgi:hypothetical protein
MAKSTNGGKKAASGEAKATAGETKARRAPARRRIDKKTAEAPVAVASELATPAFSESSELNPDEVARRAYEIYCGRGGKPGSDVEDWLEAERQLRQHRTH